MLVLWDGKFAMALGDFMPGTHANLRRRDTKPRPVMLAILVN